MHSFDGVDDAFSFYQKHEIRTFPVWGVEGSVCMCRKEDCHSPGKHPFLRRNWKSIACVRYEQTSQDWFFRYPGCGIAVVTGRQSSGRHLVVIDLDDKSNQQTVDFIDRLPSTFSYETGGGGRHWWFWTDQPIRNHVGLLPGVDVRGVGGYVVAPPSKHISGSQYGNNLLSWDAEILDMPSWLEDELLSSTRQIPRNQECEVVVVPTPVSSFHITQEQHEILTSGKINKVKDLLDSGSVKVPCGMRNTVMFRMLAYERAWNGKTRDQLLEIAIVYRDAWFESPQTMPTVELERLVRSAGRYKFNSVCKASSKKTTHAERRKERLADSRCKWYANRVSSHGIRVNLKQLEELETEFFTMLTVVPVYEPTQKTDGKWWRVKVERPRLNKKQFSTMSEFMTEWDAWFAAHGVVRHHFQSVHSMADRLRDILNVGPINASGKKMWPVSLDRVREYNVSQPHFPRTRQRHLTSTLDHATVVEYDD